MASKFLTYYYKGYVIQRERPGVYTVWSPRKQTPEGRIIREMLGDKSSLREAKYLVFQDLTGPESVLTISGRGISRETGEFLGESSKVPFGEVHRRLQEGEDFLSRRAARRSAGLSDLEE